MKLELKTFFSTELKRYRVIPAETRPENKGKISCANCRKFIYNRLSRAPFCAQHLTPVQWYEFCAYFTPIWGKKL